MPRKLITSIAILISLVFFVQPVGAKGKELEVHFINVGQGDAILVKTPDDKTILIDAGIHYGSQDEYNPFVYLKSKKIRKLDAVFITHPHDDHYKGFNYLCMKKGEKEFPLRAIYYSVEPGPAYGKFETCLDDLIKRSEDFNQISARGPPIKFGDVTFTVLYPEDQIEKSHKNKNQDSVVMKMTYKNFSVLFTGDADKTVERSMLKLNLKSTLLKVGHHGSNTATDPGFLEKVHPTYAVISANDKDGKGKTYGHPHAPTLNNLKSHDVKLYRTDLEGNVVVLSDGNKVTVKVDKDVSQEEARLWKAGKKSK